MFIRTEIHMAGHSTHINIVMRMRKCIYNLTKRNQGQQSHYLSLPVCVCTPKRGRGVEKDREIHREKELIRL